MDNSGYDLSGSERRYGVRIDPDGMHRDRQGYIHEGPRTPGETRTGDWTGERMSNYSGVCLTWWDVFHSKCHEPRTPAEYKKILGTHYRPE